MGITRHDIVKTVRELAAERPDFNYRGQGVEPKTCSYLGRQLSEPDVGEACIIGQVFERLGLSREELQRFEGYSTDAIANYATGSTIGRETVLWMAHIQDLQDGGHTWATALQNANEQYPSA